MSNKLKKIFFVLIFLTFDFINAQKIQSRVIGGEKVSSITGKEYLVALMSETYGQYTTFCAGVLISPTYVITASHCISDTDIYVFANYHILPDDQQTSNPIGDISLVERVFYHSDFMTSSNDIAVLRLSKAINIKKYPSLPSVGQTKLALEANTKMNLAGWGLTSNGSSGGSTGGSMQEGEAMPQRPPRDLHQVMTTTLSETQCKKDILGDKTVSAEKEIENNNMLTKLLCAGGELVNETNKGACSGDSGGPLVYKDGDKLTLMGIVSRGVGLCTGKKASNYARVETFLDFIAQAKQGKAKSNGMLRKGYIKDLPKGWSLVGTEKKIGKDTKIFTNDIDKIYSYNSKSGQWAVFSINNSVPPSDFMIPPKSGFWIRKP